jgi:type II secretory pathway predicted ATPase ExeA
MYEKHFGLKQRPFRPTPDSDSYYPATTHEQALARLVQGIEADEGLLLLTGAPGTGKTLLCHRLLERLPASTASAFLTSGFFAGRAALLQAILFELSLTYEGRGEQEMRLALADFLLQNYQRGQRALLLVDEAHHLTPELLEELRLLGNLEAGSGKAVQVVLVAQPAILDTLHRPELDAVRQRLAVRVTLNLLDVREAADYLVHHLRCAGARPDAVISDEALELIARGAQGVPRLLNQAAHQALVLACAAEVDQVDAEAALEALGLLGLNAGDESDEPDDEGPEPPGNDESPTPPRQLFPPVRRPA